MRLSEAILTVSIVDRAVQMQVGFFTGIMHFFRIPSVVVEILTSEC